MLKYRFLGIVVLLFSIIIIIHNNNTEKKNRQSSTGPIGQTETWKGNHNPHPSASKQERPGVAVPVPRMARVPTRDFRYQGGQYCSSACLPACPCPRLLLSSIGGVGSGPRAL